MVIIKTVNFFTYTWELYKEKNARLYFAKAMTIAEIIKVIDSEGTLESGLTKCQIKRWFSWDGIQNKKIAYIQLLIRLAQNLV